MVRGNKMKMMYGAWKSPAVIHAVGYDGKYLCGRKQGVTASDCSDGIDEEWISCKRCLKKLPDYIKKYVITTSEVERLENSYKHLGEFVKMLKGDEKARCVCEDEEGMILYLTTWVLPEFRRLLKKFESNEEVKG